MHEGYYIVHFKVDGNSDVGLKIFEGCLKALVSGLNSRKGSHSSAVMEIINNRGWKNLKDATQKLNLEVGDINTVEQMVENALNMDES